MKASETVAKNNKMFVYVFLIVLVLLWAEVSDAWGYSEHLPISLPNNWNWYVYGYISRLVSWKIFKWEVKLGDNIGRISIEKK